MKLHQTYFFLLFTITVSAQKIKLAYEPQGQVIKFYFDSLTIYTDTTSLFYVYDKDGDSKDYDLRVKEFVRKRVNEAKPDTVLFSGDFIPFNDCMNNKLQKDWYIEWAILELTKQGKLRMYDKHGQLVTMIVTKRVGKKKTNFIKRSYINKATGEKLLAETLFIRTITPKF